MKISLKHILIFLAIILVITVITRTPHTIYHFGDINVTNTQLKMDIDSSSSITDYSGNGHVFTNTGVDVGSSGAVFKDAGDVLTAPSTSVFSYSNTQAFSIYTRFKATSTDSNIYNKFTGTTGFDLRWRPVTGYAYFDYGYSANEGYVQCGTGIDISSYHSVVVVVTNSSLRQIYNDGVLCGSSVVNVGTTIANAVAFKLGTGVIGDFVGNITDVQIFSYALSSSQVQSLYETGSVRAIEGSCEDGVKDGNEVGVDCGGKCTTVCDSTEGNSVQQNTVYVNPNAQTTVSNGVVVTHSKFAVFMTSLIAKLKALLGGFRN